MSILKGHWPVRVLSNRIWGRVDTVQVLFYLLTSETVTDDLTCAISDADPKSLTPLGMGSPKGVICCFYEAECMTLRSYQPSVKKGDALPP
ncbi:hypothetical protein J6590_009141 [Homalodisca vitripennis]|nr:hypothetical protein J6590_009141 [Homalodisca vitripennis]